MRMRIAAAVLIAAPAAGFLAPAHAQDGSGTIAGEVTLTSTRGALLATSPYGRRGVPPKRAAAGSEARKVVIYLEGVKPTLSPIAMRVQISQLGEQFEPPVTALTVGSIVEFPNVDPFFHNVFSLSRVATFDLGRYPPGESRSRQFLRAGIVKVFCHLHAQMSALIMVLDHPWFATPSESGAFTLTAIPAGEHTLVAWHERIGERRERIRVQSGATTHVRFTLPVLETHP
jgi:plastocyanin